MGIQIRFDDCPYGCNSNAKLLNPDTGTMEDCPYCSERRKALMKSGVAIDVDTGKEEDLWKLLGVPKRYITSKFVYDSVVADHERAWLVEDSLSRQEEEIQEVIDNLLLSELPEYSVCFGLPIGGRVENIIFPILSTAYKQGFSVCKSVSASMFNRLLLGQDSSLDAYYNSDIVVILINDGCSYADIDTVKGLLQTRALNGKPTIFVTTWKFEACSAFLSGVKEERTLFQAYPVFVEYINGGKSSNYINSLKGVPNGLYTEDEDRGVSIGDL